MLTFINSSAGGHFTDYARMSVVILGDSNFLVIAYMQILGPGGLFKQ
jgi:hypothetical protein